MAWPNHKKIKAYRKATYRDKCNARKHRWHRRVKKRIYKWNYARTHTYMPDTWSRVRLAALYLLHSQSMLHRPSWHVAGYWQPWHGNDHGGGYTSKGTGGYCGANTLAFVFPGGLIQRKHRHRGFWDRAARNGSMLLMPVDPSPDL